MTIGWAMIGTGRVHRWMAKAIKAAGDTELIAVLSRDRARAEKFTEKYGIPQTYASLDEMLQNPKIDVVYIASPNGLHAQQTIRVAEAKKHVFCEKPMAPTPKECRLMIESCKAHGVKLGIGLQFRQHPTHIKMRELVASGELGRLVFANAQLENPPVPIPGWYYDPELSGGGVMYMSGVHRLDLLRFILGCEVEEVSAFIGEQPPDRPFEDMVAAILKFTNQAYGTIHFSLNIPHGASTLEVHGTQGSLLATDTTDQWWGGGGGELLLKTDKITTRFQFQKTDLYKDEIEDFNRCIIENREPKATGMDGLRNAELSVALFESGRLGKKISIGSSSKKP
jgi:1,5-anhydro-D-fructose reductase (1,5-anhydro-D-mannitol-forming)